MPQTEAQRAAARRNLEKARARNAAKAATPEPPPSFSEPAADRGTVADSAISFDPEKILRYALKAPHDGLAVLTGREDMRLSKVEEAVATESVLTSLELIGWTRYVVFAAPIAAVFILLAIEGSRLKVLRDMWTQRQVERDLARAAAEDQTFVKRFDEDETTQQARTARARPAAGEARAVDPTELTYLEEAV